jgi:ABC-type glucose/galactose transport system permease subunit
MTQNKQLLINNYEPINTYKYVNNNKKIYGIYVILLIILSLCIANTIFFVRINNLINIFNPTIKHDLEDKQL